MGLTMIDREFLLIKRKARRRALYNALTCGPAAMFSYAVGRVCYRAEIKAVLFGFEAINGDEEARRIVHFHRRLIRVKARLGL